jgi:hypothetical protein
MEVARVLRREGHDVTELREVLPIRAGGTASWSRSAGDRRREASRHRNSPSRDGRDGPGGEARGGPCQTEIARRVLTNWARTHRGERPAG